MYLEIFSLVIYVTFFAWCGYLICDIFQAEPFFKLIKSIAPDLAFLTVIGAFFTNNYLVILTVYSSLVLYTWL
jgi:hypothetical protein